MGVLDFSRDERQVKDMKLFTIGYEGATMEEFIAALRGAGVERVIGLPMTPDVSRRSQLEVGGTLLAAELALRHGLACNTAGGSHHAGQERDLGVPPHRRHRLL